MGVPKRKTSKMRRRQRQVVLRKRSWAAASKQVAMNKMAVTERVTARTSRRTDSMRGSFQVRKAPIRRSLACFRCAGRIARAGRFPQSACAIRKYRKPSSLIMVKLESLSTLSLIHISEPTRP